MKRLGAIIVLAAAAVVGLGFVHPFGNPRVEPERGLGTLLVHANMPEDSKQILITKCADCHSNETRWPIYARLAPGSWLIERDIIEARKKMNLSLWDQKVDTQDQMIGEIIHEAKAGEMPPMQYRLLHWDAKLTTQDVATLSGMKAANASQATGTSSPGDAARGKAVFEKRCTGCHAMEADREGPRLAGVFGRKAGSVAGFDYSPALKNSGMTWNEVTLEKWLTDPDVMVPSNNMGIAVPKAQERADLVAYFKQQK